MGTIELWELYDKKGNKTGRTVERGKPIPKGYYHICVEVWVMNKHEEVLLTQRHPDKPLGRYWECSGGGVIAGEECNEAAQRELREETGILMKPEQIHYLGTYTGSDWMMKTYICFLEDELYPELKLQKEEVVDAKWVKYTQTIETDKIFLEKAERLLKYFPIVEDLRKMLLNETVKSAII